MVRKKSIAILILACMLCAGIFTGCSQDNTQTVKPSEHVASDSPWIDSDIQGAVVAETQTRLQDDFHTAVNKDWLVKTDLAKDEKVVSAFSESQKVMEQQLMDIASGKTSVSSGANPADVPTNLLQHDETVITEFSALAKNWTERNKQNVEPLRPYLDTIKSINSTEDLTRYITSSNESLIGPGLLQVKVGTTLVDHSQNFVKLSVLGQPLLPSLTDYESLSDTGRATQEANAQKLSYILGRLGYSESEVNGLLKDAYALEIKLAEAYQNGQTASAADMAALMQATDVRRSWDELTKLEGDFPLTTLLEKNGYRVNEVSLESSAYFEELGKLYTNDNLNMFKSWYIVHTALSATDLLDQETMQYAKKVDKQCGIEKKSSISKEGDKHDSDDTDRDNDQMALDLLQKYLSGPLGQVYVARYCTAEQKAQLAQMINEIRDAYKVMLNQEDWLSEDTRKIAIEKLDKLTVRVLYPDTYKDYMGLSLDGSTTLLGAVAAVNNYQFGSEAQRVGTPVDLSYWDLEELPTTTVNAYYIPSENSINIFAGYLADGTAFNVNASKEQNYACVGQTIGHEISHAFDTNGSNYDADGQYRDWWTAGDKAQFQVRTNNLKRYYSSLTPYPGAGPLDGDKIAGEAIADITGMKVVLGIAAKDSSFDYKKFFTSYANSWRIKNTFEVEKQLVDKDVHPLAYLRTNTVVMQFDEFLNAFGIVEGDGMYLPADKRILVW